MNAPTQEKVNAEKIFRQEILIKQHARKKKIFTLAVVRDKNTLEKKSLLPTIRQEIHTLKFHLHG